MMEIDMELTQLAKQEQSLIIERRKLRCKENKTCSILDLITTVQIG